MSFHVSNYLNYNYSGTNTPVQCTPKRIILLAILESKDALNLKLLNKINKSKHCDQHPLTKYHNTTFIITSYSNV